MVSALQASQFSFASTIVSGLHRLTFFLSILKGYLENYGTDDQQIILLHVYNSIDSVQQCASDDDSDEVSDMREDDMINISNAARQQAKPMLEPFEDKCKKKKIAFKTRFEFGSPGEAICQVAKDEHATCILLGNRGLGAFRRRILGSVSDHVVHHSKVPVIIVPPNEH